MSTVPLASVANAVHVVVVEDDEATCYAISRMLQAQGYQVESVGTAEAARDVVRRLRPLCVVLDLHLPDGFGADLAREWRLDYGHGIVIVGITAYVDLSDPAEFAGVDFVLHKPVDVEKLKTILPRCT